VIFHQNDDKGHDPHKRRCWFILLQTKILGSVKSPKPGWRVASKICVHLLQTLYKRKEFYAPQTKILAVWRTKNCAISHPLLNEGSCIREYSTIRLLSNRHLNDLKEMYSIGLNFEYSRMQLHSLSSGCEIAQFFVRYMGFWKDTPPKRRFWKAEQTFQTTFSKHFSRV
jgi:hypothetical protein